MRAIDAVRTLRSQAAPKFFFSIDEEVLGTAIHPFVHGIIQDDVKICVYAVSENFLYDEVPEDVIRVSTIDNKKDAVFMNLSLVLYSMVELVPAIQYYFIITDDPATIELREVVNRKLRAISEESKKRISEYEGESPIPFGSLVESTGISISSDKRVFYPNLSEFYIVSTKDPWDIREKIAPEFGSMLQNGSEVSYTNKFIIMLLDENFPHVKTSPGYNTIISILRRSDGYDEVVGVINSMGIQTYDKVDLLSQYLVLVGSKFYSYPELRRELKYFDDITSDGKYRTGSTINISLFGDVKLPPTVQNVYNVRTISELIRDYPVDVIYALRLEGISGSYPNYKLLL